MIKNLVFDFGGIIADFEFSRALAAFERVGLKNPAEYLDSYHQRGFFRELESGRIGADEFVRRLGECAGREVSYAEAREAWLGFFLLPVSLERLACLEELRRDYRLYVLSNTNPLGAQQRIFACRKAARRLFRQVVPLLRDEVHETRSGDFRPHGGRGPARSCRDALHRRQRGQCRRRRGVGLSDLLPAQQFRLAGGGPADTRSRRLNRDGDFRFRFSQQRIGEMQPSLLLPSLNRTLADAEDTPARQCPNKFDIALAYSYLCSPKST